MTVSRDQAQMITALAIAARPHRAPTWDAPGVMAQLGKVAELDLAEVTIAALRLARDPYAATPADIAKPTSECWQEQLKPSKRALDVAPVGSRCTVCGDQEIRCQSRWALTGNPARDEIQGRHEFTHPHERTVDIAPVVTELKGLAVREEVEA